MGCVPPRFTQRPPPSMVDVKKSLKDYISDAQDFGCPFASKDATAVFEEEDRPQPRLDREL